jgi:hypothetical protein
VGYFKFGSTIVKGVANILTDFPVGYFKFGSIVKGVANILTDFSCKHMYKNTEPIPF